MSMTGKWRRAAAAFGAIALLAAACGGGDGDQGSSEPDGGGTETDGGDSEDGAGGGDVLSSITVGINNPNYATQLALVIAIERGYFAEEGINDIEIIETDEYIPALIGGSLHLTQGDTDAAFGSAEASGEDIVFTGTYRNSEYQILGVGPGVETAEDLKGGDLTGGALGSRNQRLLARIVEELGLDSETDVNFVPQGGNSDATLQAIIAGTVKGGSLFPRHKFALEAAGGQFLYENLAELPQEGVLVMGDFYEENFDTVVAYWRATLKARADMWAAKDDPEAAKEIIDLMRNFGFEIPEEFEGVFNLEVEQVSEDGGFDPSQMDELVAEQIELENLPEGIDWRQFVDLGALHQAQDDLGITQNPASLD